jgi:hypothetical protein
MKMLIVCIALLAAPVRSAVELRCAQPMTADRTVTVVSREALRGSLRLFTMTGREVASGQFDTAPSGSFRWRLPAGALASGIYLLSAEWAGGRTTRLIILLR